MDRSPTEKTEDKWEVDNPNMMYLLENRSVDHTNFFANAHAPHVEKAT
jgi:hypothetical protein